jgi:two-component system KDP operon response regulator KdpE
MFRSSTPAPRKALTVLIVDDDPVIRAYLRRALEGLGCLILEAGTFETAVSTLETIPTDAVVIDVGLPGRSGFELLEYMRLVPSLAGITVLILTGQFPNMADQLLLKEHRAAIFYKPEGRGGVLRHIGRMMSGKTPHAAA